MTSFLFSLRYFLRSGSIMSFCTSDIVIVRENRIYSGASLRFHVRHVKEGFPTSCSNERRRARFCWKTKMIVWDDDLHHCALRRALFRKSLIDLTASFATIRIRFSAAISAESVICEIFPEKSHLLRLHLLRISPQAIPWRKICTSMISSRRNFSREIIRHPLERYCPYQSDNLFLSLLR